MTSRIDPRRAVRRGAALAALAAIAIIVADCSRPGPGNVGWRTYTDPSALHAYTVEVPADWIVFGQTTQFAPRDIRTALFARPRDGSMTLFIGDLTVPKYVAPTAGTPIEGMPEGATYMGGEEGTLTVAAYRPGENFAAGWGASRVAQLCPGAAFRWSRPMGDTTNAIIAANAQMGARDEVHAGEATFSCTYGAGVPGAGYAFAATELATLAGIQFWSTPFLAGYVARADHAAQANAILAHMAATMRLRQAFINPGGPSAAPMGQPPAAASQSISDANAAIEKSLADSFAYRQAAEDRANANFSRAQRGEPLLP